MYGITYRGQTKLMFNVETQLTLSSLLMIVNKARKLGIGGPWIQSNQDSRRQGGMEFMEYVDDTNLRTSLLIPSNRTKKMSAWQWPVIPDHVGCNNLDDHTVVRSQQRHAGKPLLATQVLNEVKQKHFPINSHLNCKFKKRPWHGGRKSNGT